MVTNGTHFQKMPYYANKVKKINLMPPFKSYKLVKLMSMNNKKCVVFHSSLTA